MTDEEAKDIVAQLKEKHQLEMLEEDLKDNKAEFNYKDIEYRVRLFTRKDKEEIYLLNIKKYNQLLKDPDILKEADLYVVYKNKGLDIAAIDSEIRRYQAEIMDLHLKLGKEEEDKSPESVCKAYHDKIVTLQESLYVAIIKRAQLLNHSLENILEEYISRISLFFSLEKLENEKWIRAFKSLDEYDNFNDEELLSMAQIYNLKLNIK